MDEKLTCLQQAQLFSELDEAALQQILARSRTLSLRKNAILMSEGDIGESMYVILSGSVRIFVSEEDGNEMTLSIDGRGACIGEISLLDDEPRTASAVTTEKSEVLAISKASFIELLAEHPNIALDIIRALTARLRRATDGIRSLALRNVYQRLVLKLEELSTTRDDEKFLERKYSHQELGKMIGASREMVGKVMAELVKGGYVEVRDQHLHLLREFPHDW